ncbi:MAG: hypothetical protein MUC50_04205 [Myxococcota bacterium]|nr:hypothetical protein [Myxococcota bacterium]
MTQRLTAEDLRPLLMKLSLAERRKLAQIAARSTGKSDEELYAANPPRSDEFDSDDDPLAWEGEDWEEFYEAR